MKNKLLGKGKAVDLVIADVKGRIHRKRPKPILIRANILFSLNIYRC